MVDNAYLLFGLAAAMLYAVAASALKTATERGMSSLKITLLANLATAGAFLMFVPWGGERLLPPIWWPSLIVGGLFFLGQLFTILALQCGHASIATPILGSKVVIVALLLAAGFSYPVGLNIWTGAVLTTVGILVLAWPNAHLSMRQVLPAAGLSMLAAFSFGLFDILTQFWSRLPGLTFGLLMPAAMVVAALTSAGFIMLLEPQMPRVPSAARRHLALGIGLMVSQALILIGAIGHFGDAAGLNVVYGSRGIWSVMTVWLFGVHFSADERLSPRTVVRRMAGATLIAAAVLLVFWKS